MAIEPIREKSWRLVEGLGLPVNLALPALDPVLALRGADQVAKRLWCLLGCAASAYGFDKARALSWIEHEGAGSHLNQIEREFLTGRSIDDRFKLQIEGMWALCWAYGLVESMDFTAPCPNSFVKMLPDLKKAQPTAGFISSMKARAVDSVAAAQDAAYCLHWAIVQCGLKNELPKLRIQPYVISERRRALDWLTGEEDWYSISLDT